MLNETLSKRITHRYVGTYRHLDQWEEVGTMSEILSTVVPPSESEDGSAGPKTTKLITVDSSHPKKEIERALRDRFTKQGCAHDYDCCGCASHSVSRVKKVAAKLYEVEIHTSYNF